MQVFMMDAGTGELTLHAHITGKFTKSRLRHIESIFLSIVLGLYERGMDEVITWIEAGDEKQLRFAQFLGFESSGFLKVLTLDDGREVMMEEMFYTIPIDKESPPDGD